MISLNPMRTHNFFVISARVMGAALPTILCSCGDIDTSLVVRALIFPWSRGVDIAVNTKIEYKARVCDSMYEFMCFHANASHMHQFATT